MKLFAITATLAIAVTAQASELTTYKYVLNNYPVTSKDCMAVAQQRANEFAAANGLTGVLSRCEQSSQNGLNIVLSYRAEEPVAFVSTDYHVVSVAPRGRFDDLASCQAATPAKAAEFTEQTGLAATFAFCNYATSTGSRRFALRVDGFGATNVPPRFDSYTMDSVPKGITLSAFQDGLGAAVARHGGHMSDATIHSQLAFADVGIHYYAAKPINFLEPIAHSNTDKIEQCQAYLAEVKAAYDSTSNPAALVYCGYVHVGAGYEATAVVVGPKTIDTFESVEAFAKFEECDAARAGLMATYAAQSGSDIRAAVCKRGNDAFHVNFLEAIH